MTIKDRILRRKIGAFEVLLAFMAWHTGTFSFFSALLCAVLAGLFYFAKREFQGEFSLEQLFALFKQETETKGRDE